MIKHWIKKFAYNVLGQDSYLKLLHKGFFIAYNSGYLKKDPVYKYHYFVNKLINPDDTIIDMGGNLGYYTKIFAQLAPKGRVIAIEPVVPFFNIIQWATQGATNITLYNYALGTEEKKIQINVPATHGYLRPGLANVAEAETSKNDYVFDVQMKKASALLSALNKIDYIKCDIEGYEEYVIPEIKEILIRHKPILQIETWGTHKETIDNLMKEIGYQKYMLENDKLHSLSPFESGYGDYIFAHPDKDDKIRKFL